MSTNPSLDTRKIALLDLDAFFASAELLRQPQLRDKPFAVGGGGDRGVVATANYLARQYGVRSAMAGSQARRLCPQLIFVRPDHAYYRAMSNQVFEVLQQYTEIIEPASIDEFYLDLTHNQHYQGSASLTVSAIREQLRALGLTASAGISNQKMVAKIASEENKPDGQYLVTPEQVSAYLAQLDLKRIPGIGPKSLQKLHYAGLFLGKDVQQAELTSLQRILGEKAGWLVYQRCLGNDPRAVITERVRKSVGVEETLSQDATSLRQLEQFLEQVLLPQLQKRMKVSNWQQAFIKSQTIKLKFSDFQQTTVSRTANLASPSLFYQLLRDAWDRRQQRQVRLIGISVALPDPDDALQLELELE
ncbi:MULTISPECIES: DNA polymerase IV [Pseudidiomarina]|uniref:DNA polymerase IV n=2 Tax=Pseudidiomarina TaxID=2800384 RepID=A0A368UKY8_9GAMM|nr:MULTISPECIES: DNA polymerase IV [Pseudidiomarina]PWW09320.1 DNA polymerase-4 [Pseudidiomarina maritima]RBP87307.1 DNA polymerase-4 [Pseudidiomarina tainanensis]RCW29382.1 DNA polymerase-4 [Pseudidiomarina tainanensis]